MLMDYHLDLVGLRTVLRTPEPIAISDRLQPFLCRRHEKADCTITVRISDRLPQMLPGGVWRGPEYYCRQGNTLKIFHCSAGSEAAFAVTQLLENGSVEITVLPEYQSYFQGSSGIFNRIGMETLLLQHNGLLLHASLINYAGSGIAFTGPSGVGKSTQAQLWEECLDAQILNGDRAALRISPAHWTAYGSPYAGTSGIYCPDQAPLKAIVVLAQGKENHLRKLSPTEAFAHIYPELSIHHWDRAFTEKATDLCVALLTETPVYLLECVPDRSAVLLLKKGLAL